MRNLILAFISVTGFLTALDVVAAPVPHRIDCQFIDPTHSCYLSSSYDADDTTTPGTVIYSNILLGVGCDGQTIYDDSGRQMYVPATEDLLVPLTSMLPSLTVPAAADTDGLDLAGLHSGCTLVTTLGTITGQCIVQISP